MKYAYPCTINSFSESSPGLPRFPSSLGGGQQLKLRTVVSLILFLFTNGIPLPGYHYPSAYATIGIHCTVRSGEG